MLKKMTLLAATSAMTLASNAAFAQANNNYPAAEIRGNGASSIANILVQELNCFGGTDNNLGFADNTTTDLPEHNYVPTKPTTGNPVYDCAVKSVQDPVNGKYVSTGSGNGRANFRNKNGAAIASNPFGVWSNIHYAFSDSPLSSSDLTTYNNATPNTGPAIQIPAYVLPVAVAYAPFYGKRNTGTGILNLAFNVKVPRADGTGGLRLKKTTYCAIFNGTITNWNDAAIKVDNGNQSLMSPNDDLSRWTTAGVPIKLVGRLENSGTTNIFTRALTAQCGGKFTAGGADQLPAAAISNAVYNKQSGVLQSGAEGVGLFGRADGSDGVTTAISLVPADPAPGEFALNGRLGYVGADWVAPSTLSGSTLHSADLQSGTTTKFVAPTAANATLSFKGILPPQSDSKGKYNTTPATGSLPGLRTDPLAWVLPPSVSGNPLANPAAGYPITGTANLLTYTCYASSATRNAVQGFAMLHFGKVTIADDLTKVPAKLATSTSKDAAGIPIGIAPRNGIAPLPAQWATAIVETFLTKVTTGNNPSSLNLWIQDKLQKKSTDVLAANPTCSGGIGL